ncbi:MAG: LamG domain-containing protein [Paludibacter sp.]|nr:LamG domain-containing protein [Paludibacter sp.]
MRKITFLSAIALLFSGVLQSQTPVLSYTFDGTNELADDSQTYSGYLNEGAVVENLSGNKALFISDEAGWFDLNVNAAKEKLAGLNNYTITIDFYQKEEGNVWDRGFTLWSIIDEYNPSQRININHLPWAWEFQWPDGVEDHGPKYLGAPHDAVRKGVWNTLTLVKDDASLLFYINGELKTNSLDNAEITILPTDFFATTGQFAIGKAVWGWDPSPQNAYFDNFKVFGTVLTQTEVAALYAARPEDPFLLENTQAALQKTINQANQIKLPGLAPTAALQTAIDAAEGVLASGTVEDLNAENVTLKAAIRTYYKAVVALGTFVDKIADATFDTDVAGADFSATYTNWELVPVEEGQATGVVARAGVAEIYMEAETLSQEVRNLQNGYYLVYVQAFYRDTEEKGAKFFANNDTVDVISLYDDIAAIDYTNIDSALLAQGAEPSSMETASAVFAANPDLYGNYVIVNVTDRKLNLGLLKPAWWYWLLFDNFKLYSIPYDPSAIPNVIADTVTDENAPVYNFLGQKVGKAKDLDNLQSGVYIVGGKKILIRK